VNGHDTYLQMVCMSSGNAALLPVPDVQCLVVPVLLINIIQNPWK